MKKNISIVIVNWNTSSLLKQALDRLTKDADSSSIEIIVVDNASTDDSVKILQDYKQRTTNYKLILNKLNRGFSFACNQGLATSEGEWILFLNPDVEISNNEIQTMKSFAISRKLDAVCPITEEAYEKPLPTPMSLLIEFTPLKDFFPLSSFGTKTLFGGCLIIKRTVLNDIGGWDERFFLWFEDSDLTKRLLENGYHIGRIDIAVKHRGGSSFKLLNDKQRKEIFFLSMEIFARKHFSFLGQLIVKLVKKRYCNNNLLPLLESGTTITVPNMKKILLTDFLKKNEDFIRNTKIDEVIIVTSAFSKSDFLDIRSKFSEVRFVFIEKNEGYAKTVNIGLRISRSRWTGTVNDDTILNKDLLKECLKNTSPEYGSINPVIYDKNNNIESAGIDILPKGKAEVITEINSKHYIYETDATNAAAVIYSHEALNDVGLFDERFGSYLEDIDLSLRLKREGFKNIVVKSGRVIHLKHATASNLGAKKAYLDFKNWILVIGKNWGMKKILIHLPEILLERLRNGWGIVKIKYENS